MFASRASSERPPTSRTLTLTSASAWLRHTSIVKDLRWVASVCVLYAAAILAATLALAPYFSQTWDVMTFVGAARGLLGPGWQALYAQTRSAQVWPYAYPPLHAAVIAPLLAIGGAPDWLLARVPPLLADAGVGLLVYAIIAKRTANRRYARLALAGWLLNPVTFYDTAVQGHFESEWLFFVLLAYYAADSKRALLWASLSLAAAFLFKQVAILFAIPYWLSLVLPYRAVGRAGLRRTVASVALFCVPVLLVSAPFLLYSSDFLYMNLQYVAEVPLQTQSWLVALTGLFGPNLWPVQHSTLVVALAALLISILAARRGLSLYRTAALIAIAFFLLSQKVMGYYYVMLLPFALIELLPARRFGLLGLMFGTTALISLSPYFAPWADPAHWPYYALLGTINSVLWLAIGIALWRMPAADGARGEVSLWPVLFAVLLFVEAVAAALVQPLVNNPTSPIRSPIVPAGLVPQALLASGLVLAATLAAVVAMARLVRGDALRFAATRFAFLAALVYLVLCVLTLSLTKESTAALELALKSLGL